MALLTLCLRETVNHLHHDGPTNIRKISNVMCSHYAVFDKRGNVMVLII